MGEDPKHYFQKVMPRGPYADLLGFMAQYPDFSVAASVKGDNGRYVHEKSTVLEMEPQDTSIFDVGQEEMAYKLVGAVQEALKPEIVTWNKQITADLYAALEYHRSDEALADWMDANEWRFTEDGDRVLMTDYLPIDNIPQGIRDKVLREYAVLFDRTPEQVYSVLKQRDVRFDKRGSKVDTSEFKRVGELPDGLRARIFDKYRDLLVEGDDFWAESEQDGWVEKLEGMGFSRVKIRYSLGYSQGDGASFTADSIDVKQLCQVMHDKQKIEAAAMQLANGLME